MAAYLRFQPTLSSSTQTFSTMLNNRHWAIDQERLEDLEATLLTNGNLEDIIGSAAFRPLVERTLQDARAKAPQTA